MNLRLILAIAVALGASSAIAQEKVVPRGGPAAAPAPPANSGPIGPLKSVRDKASYSFGMMIGTNLKRQGVDIDINLLVQGLKEASAGGKLLLTDAQAGEAIQAFEKEVATVKAKESKEFLVNNKKKQGVQTTPSGLQYKVIKAGKGPKPKKNDAVSVTYRGTFINGDEFDSSRGEPFPIGVSDVIPGWQEALQLMEVGSKWMLYVPADLAYGEQGQPPIGPNTTLVFELELLGITKPPAAGAAKARPKLE